MPKKYHRKPWATERIPIDRPEEIHYRSYQRSAQSRHIPFELPFSVFCDLILMECIYCGTEPHSTRILFQKEYYYYQGIDRVDSDKGYTIDNCVPCCSGCNMRKGSLTVAQFLEREKQRIIISEMLR